MNDYQEALQKSTQTISDCFEDLREEIAEIHIDILYWPNNSGRICRAGGPTGHHFGERVARVCLRDQIDLRKKKARNEILY